jgi:hypothetical protein
MNDFVASTTAEDRYLTTRLSYSRHRDSGEEQFGAITLRAFLRSWFIWWLVSYAYFVIGSIAVSIIFGLSGGDARAGAGLLIFVWIASVVAAGFVPQRRWVSAWDFLIDGRADGADSSYSMIAKSLMGRQTPADIKPIRLRNPHARGPGNYLRVEIPQYEVWVSVFAYGDDLFVGWTMVRRNRLGGIYFRYLWERLLVLAGKSTDFHFQIAANEARALRDAVHNSAREGVELAITGASGPTVAEVFGFEVPIQQSLPRGQSPSATQGLVRPPSVPPTGSPTSPGMTRPSAPPSMPPTSSPTSPGIVRPMGGPAGPPVVAPPSSTGD